MVDKPGGVFLRRAEELTEDERVLLQTVARIVSQRHRRNPDRTGGSPRVERSGHRTASSPRCRHSPSRSIRCRRANAFSATGWAASRPTATNTSITLEPGDNTPLPWVNVIASPHIGTVVSESGSAYTWAENAHEFRLTTWHNDPLSDASGEAFYIRDEETGAFWSPTPLPARGKSGYVCRHGFGYSVFEHYEAGIASELHTYVAMDAPVKFVVVKLRNSLAAYAQAVAHRLLGAGARRMAARQPDAHRHRNRPAQRARCSPAMPMAASAPAAWCSPTSASASAR
jgi:cyclic beta-1,2-glucan synthetase